jgi:hypothetical protein
MPVVAAWLAPGAVYGPADEGRRFRDDWVAGPP